MKHSIFAAAIAIATAFSAPAGAAIISGSYTATVYSGTDGGNYFGGGNLAGKSITVGYSYDTAGGSYNLSSGSDNLIGTSANSLIQASISVAAAPC